ncbi:putative metalloprotease CJM1_0395 family protein [Desulfonatronospira sp.]|uniref:putative metalloprotease CJM1_0395 family protein n=1 Tax=Desulfonatronospira sp. TaxID=1962951 RepID=UPI0025BA7928|nr:putative metalloprotease CJM1_0395 family protein [Desulfonatronospira sp.]
MDISATGQQAYYTSEALLGGTGHYAVQQQGSHSCCESPCPFCGALATGDSHIGSHAGAGVSGAEIAAAQMLLGDRVTLSHSQDNHNPGKPGTNGHTVKQAEPVGYGPDARPLAGSEHGEKHQTKHPGYAPVNPHTESTPSDAVKSDQAESGDDPLVEEHGLRDENKLSAEERQELQELRQRDAEVRAHEQAHIAAGGQYVTGGASCSYETGPDGRQYAVEGEVSIDSSPVPGDAEKTEEKARTVRRAALAPANPSPQDQRVAADAARMEAEARTEQRLEEREEQQEASEPRQSKADNSSAPPPPATMKAAIQAYQSMMNSF